MRNKGYTLIELLAVIVILALLIVLIFPSVINTIQKGNEEEVSINSELIINAASSFVKNNSSEFYSFYGNTYCISLDTLVESKYLDKSNLIDSKVVKVNYNKKFIYEIVDKDNCNELVVDLDLGLTPVKYNGTNWVVADTTKKWHDYKNQEWANAVLLNAGITKNIGDVVTVEGENKDVKAMFVWVPRYEYKIDGEYASGTSDLPGEININFISKNITEPSNGYKIHSSFWWDSNNNGVSEKNEQLSGIWVGKFETTGTSTNPTILPNINSLTNQNINQQFTTAQIFNNYLLGNSHMMKNSEWGAVAYLSQSKYGKYGNSLYTSGNKEIYQNKSSITGNSNGTPSQTNANTQCSYNDITDRGSGTGSCGGGASTTGNITGIYDMSGGANENVMGYLSLEGISFGATSEGNYSGFITPPESKYYNLYTTTDISVCGNACSGHSLGETSNWYLNNNVNISNTSPWYVRGMTYNDSNAGIFSFSSTTGSTSTENSFRIVLTSIKN